MKPITVISAIISLLVFTPLAYMLADNQPPYEYDVTNSYVIPQENQINHQVVVHWKFKRINRLCPGTVYRSIVDATSGAITIFDPVPASSEVTMKSVYLDRTFVLPPNLAPGLHMYRANITFKCNALQQFYPLLVRTPDLPFNIVP